MYGSNTQILKEIKIDGGTLRQCKSVQHRPGLTKGGRGTIKTVVTYPVYWMPDNYDLDLVDFYWEGRKSDSNKVFKGVQKYGVVGYQRLIVLAGEIVAEMEGVNNEKP